MTPKVNNSYGFYLLICATHIWSCHQGRQILLLSSLQSSYLFSETILTFCASLVVSLYNMAQKFTAEVSDTDLKCKTKTKTNMPLEERCVLDTPLFGGIKGRMEQG